MSDLAAQVQADGAVQDARAKIEKRLPHYAPDTLLNAFHAAVILATQRGIAEQVKALPYVDALDYTRSDVPADPNAARFREAVLALFPPASLKEGVYATWQRKRSYRCLPSN